MFLEFEYKGKIRKAKLEVKEKHMYTPDYVLTGKDGYSLYFFRVVDGELALVYGELEEGLKAVIIEALKSRFHLP